MATTPMSALVSRVTQAWTAILTSMSVHQILASMEQPAGYDQMFEHRENLL